MCVCMYVSVMMCVSVSVSVSVFSATTRYFFCMSYVFVRVRGWVFFFWRGAGGGRGERGSQQLATIFLISSLISLFGEPRTEMGIDTIDAQWEREHSDIILLTQCYYHWGTRLNAMKRFCLCSLRSHLNILTFSLPLTGGCSEGLARCVQIFF